MQAIRDAATKQWSAERVHHRLIVIVRFISAYQARAAKLATFPSPLIGSGLGSSSKGSNNSSGLPRQALLKTSRLLANSKPMASLWLSLMPRSEEHTSELQSRGHLVCRLLLEKKNQD